MLPVVIPCWECDSCSPSWPPYDPPPHLTLSSGAVWLKNCPFSLQFHLLETLTLYRDTGSLKIFHSSLSKHFLCLTTPYFQEWLFQTNILYPKALASGCRQDHLSSFLHLHSAFPPSPYLILSATHQPAKLSLSGNIQLPHFTKMQRG